MMSVVPFQDLDESFLVHDEVGLANDVEQLVYTHIPISFDVTVPECPVEHRKVISELFPAAKKLKRS